MLFEKLCLKYFYPFPNQVLVWDVETGGRYVNFSQCSISAAHRVCCSCEGAWASLCKHSAHRDPGQAQPCTPTVPVHMWQRSKRIHVRKLQAGLSYTASSMPIRYILPVYNLFDFSKIGLHFNIFINYSTPSYALIGGKSPSTFLDLTPKFPSVWVSAVRYCHDQNKLLSTSSTCLFFHGKILISY